MRTQKILVITASLAGAIADEYVQSGRRFSCRPAGNDGYLFTVYECR